MFQKRSHTVHIVGKPYSGGEQKQQPEERERSRWERGPVSCGGKKAPVGEILSGGKAVGQSL